MERLDDHWILLDNRQHCEQQEKAPNTLGLKNMAGVFIVVGAGIVGGIGLIIIEMAYKKHQIRKQRKMELAKHAADKWRETIKKRKTLKAAKSSAMQRRIQSNGQNAPATVSLAVDEIARFKVPPKSPGRAWPGDSDIRQRTFPMSDDGGLSPATYTADIV